MSVVMTGNQNNVTTPLTATIVSLANNGSGLIRVSTGAAPHLFASNDVIQQQCSAPSANGTFRITVIDSTHYDLIGSTFVSTGIGLATDLSLTPQIMCPSDGDPFSSQLSGMLSSQQATLDRTQYLQASILSGSANLGKLQLSICAHNFQPSITWGGLGPGPYASMWCDLPASVVSLGQRWVMLGQGSSANFVMLTFDGQDTSATTLTSSAVTGSGFSAVPRMSICFDASNQVWIAYTAANGAVGVYKYLGAFTSITANGAGQTDCGIVFLAPSTIVYAGQAPSGGSFLATVAGGVSLGSITFANGIILRSSGSVVLATDKTSPGTNIYRSSSGTTWITTATGTAFGSGAQILDIAWNQALGLWLAVGTNSVPQTQFWTSPDGSNWVPISTLGTTSIAKISALGIGWVAITGNGGVIYSLDGITWWPTGATLSAANSIISSANQLAIVGIQTGSSGNGTFRFSTSAGFADVHL